MASKKINGVEYHVQIEQADITLDRAFDMMALISPILKDIEGDGAQERIMKAIGGFFSSNNSEKAKDLFKAVVDSCHLKEKDGGLEKIQFDVHFNSSNLSDAMALFIFAVQERYLPFFTTSAAELMAALGLKKVAKKA